MSVLSALCEFTYQHRALDESDFAVADPKGDEILMRNRRFVVGRGLQGLWSFSRGLARGLTDRGEYKRMMDMADSPRRGDQDGRGNLSEAP